MKKMSIEHRMIGELIGMSYIGKRIFISGFPGANNIQLLKKNNIVGVVTCARELQPKHYPNIAYHFLDLRDRSTEQLVDHLFKTIPFIDKHIKRGNILIHCAMGKSRSVSVAMAYLILRHDLSYQNSLKLIKRARCIAGPNRGFRKQLKSLKQEIIRRGGIS